VFKAKREKKREERKKEGKRTTSGCEGEWEKIADREGEHLMD